MSIGKVMAELTGAVMVLAVVIVLGGEAPLVAPKLEECDSCTARHQRLKRDN